MRNEPNNETEKQDKNESKANEENIIRIITLGSDWQEVLSTIVIEQSLDPMNIDIIKLTDAFTVYLQKLQDFDFRIPARFVLIAAILLTMKCETLLEEEEKKLSRLENEEIAKLNLEAPMLMPPVTRKPVRKVTLTELISAMNKALEIKRKKEDFFKERGHIPSIQLPDITEDIEKKIEKIYNKIRSKGSIRFTELVPVWKRKDIVDVFIPLLHLSNRGMVDCEQEELFKEIFIRLK